MRMNNKRLDMSVRCDVSNTVSNLNISLAPKNFINKNISPIGQIQDKWFINLCNKTIPPEVCCLLHLGENFYLPNSSNKKIAVYEFIKDIESNITNVNDTSSLEGKVGRIGLLGGASKAGKDATNALTHGRTDRTYGTRASALWNFQNVGQRIKTRFNAFRKSCDRRS